MNDMHRPEQIIPATGWYALYYQDEPPYYACFPLVCFAIGHTFQRTGEIGERGKWVRTDLFDSRHYEENSGDPFEFSVVGYSGGEIIESVEISSNFGLYLHESEFPLSKELLAEIEKTYHHRQMLKERQETGE